MPDALNERTFPLSVVLSVVGRKMLCENISQLYDILNFLTGDNLFTHQLPRAARECRPWLTRQHPLLEDYDDASVNGENWRAWLTAQEAKYGPTLTLRPIPADDQTRRNPLEELMEMRGPENVIVVELPSSGAAATPTEPQPK